MAFFLFYCIFLCIYMFRGLFNDNGNCLRVLLLRDFVCQSSALLHPPGGERERRHDTFNTIFVNTVQDLSILCIIIYFLGRSWLIGYKIRGREITLRSVSNTKAFTPEPTEWRRLVRRFTLKLNQTVKY